MKGYGMTVLAGILFYLVFLMAMIPAGCSNTLLAHYVDKKFQIANAQGTIWRGAGNLYGLDDIRWNMDASELIFGRLHVQVMINDAVLPMDVLITPTRIEMKHVIFILPAALLSDIAKPLKPMALGGQLILSTERFSVSNTFSGNIDMQWRNASSILSQVQPIGTYHFIIKGLGHQLNLHLATQEGPLFLQGEGVWSPQDGIRFLGSANSQNTQLLSLLSLIGSPNESGIYSIHVVPAT